MAWQFEKPASFHQVIGTNLNPLVSSVALSCTNPPYNLSTRKAEKASECVKLRFTRHARNRMRLYGIAIEDVEEVYRDPLTGPETEGTRAILLEKPQPSFADRPLNVVYIEEKGSYLTVAVDPLKRIFGRPRS